MRSPFRLILMIFLVLWLPAQGFAMAVSSGCDDTHQPQGGKASHDPHGGIAADRDGHHHAGALCGDCDFCHQCGAAALSAMPVIGHALRPGFQRTMLTVDFSSHIPDSPHRPPLAMPS